MTPIRFDSTSWKSYLPKSYNWAEDLKVTKTDTIPSTATQIIAVDKTGSLLCKELEGTYAQLIKSLNYKGKNPLNIVGSDTQAVVLLPITTTSENPSLNDRQFGLDAAKAVCELNAKEVCFVLGSGMSAQQVLQGFTAGFFSSRPFKGLSDESPEYLPEKVSLYKSDANYDPALSIAETLTRTLQDAPPNLLTPSMFAQVAKDVCQSNPSAKCEIYKFDELKKMGAGSIISVAAGSTEEPHLIVIDIPGKDNSKCVSLVGKGVTFDTGGISIKPSLGMSEMKYDMSGAAAVMGAAQYFLHNQPPVRVICAIGAVENMPGPNATRPGDIVTAMNGKTIEILNTDAEGRLVLADVLHHVITEYQPKWVIDIATLTGAVLYALGHAGAAALGNDKNLIDKVMDAAQSSGEQLWPLPLWPEFEKEVKSPIADVMNIAKPNVLAGTIMGAMFIKQFVGQTPWVHLDIAGAAWSCMTTGYPKNNGSAYGLRTMIEMVKKTK
jgi:leucyl aminopeptidase